MPCKDTLYFSFGKAFGEKKLMIIRIRISGKS